MKKRWLAFAWQGLAGLVFVFGAGVVFLLVTGSLEPVSFPYYGVGLSDRLPVLFTLLIVLQGLALGDAVILAWQRRGGRWWAAWPWPR